MGVRGRLPLDCLCKRGRDSFIPKAGIPAFLPNRTSLAPPPFPSEVKCCLGQSFTARRRGSSDAGIRRTQADSRRGAAARRSEDGGRRPPNPRRWLASRRGSGHSTRHGSAEHKGCHSPRPPPAAPCRRRAHRPTPAASCRAALLLRSSRHAGLPAWPARFLARAVAVPAAVR